MVSFLATFVSTTLLIMIAEFGDKTNLVALSLMTKSRKPFLIAVGGIVGIGLVTGVGVYLGYTLGAVWQLRNIAVVAGIIFITLGILTFMDESTDEPDLELKPDGNMTVFIKAIYLVALAELGDKSQIFVITAATTLDPWAILLGSIMGMAIIMVITAILGKPLIERVSKQKLNILSGALFVLAGAWLLLSNLSI